MANIYEDILDMLRVGQAPRREFSSHMEDIDAAIARLERLMTLAPADWHMNLEDIKEQLACYLFVMRALGILQRHAETQEESLRSDKPPQLITNSKHLVTECQDENGVTIALLDTLIAVAHIVVTRDLTHPTIQETLKDVGSNAHLRYVMRAGHELRCPEGLKILPGISFCQYQDAQNIFCAPASACNATRAVVYPDGTIKTYCETHYTAHMLPYYTALCGLAQPKEHFES